MTQDRWSAGSARNQGSVSSIRATAEVASAPACRSIRRRVAASGGRLAAPPDFAACGHPVQPVTSRVAGGRARGLRRSRYRGDLARTARALWTFCEI